MAPIMVKLPLCILALAGSALGLAVPTKGKVEIRKEWNDLTTDEQVNYIDAVKCLRTRPSALASEELPGVKDRLDDFVATHINYTSSIHLNALLLPWHRHFLFLWESTLKEECGLTGSVPYWNWVTSTPDSPMWGDTPTSIGSNGVDDPNAVFPCDLPTGCTPPRGGGCIKSGPFKDFQIHMGPIDISYFRPGAPPPPNAYAYNPRCAQRSVNFDILSRRDNQTTIDKLLGARDIEEFQSVMDARFNALGAHVGGHMTIGDTMRDAFCSPQEPMFMLHHGMIDRMWTMWQAQDPATRLVALNGTTQLGDPVGAPLATLDTEMEFGVLDRPRKVREIMDTMRFDYMYTYDS